MAAIIVGRSTSMRIGLHAEQRELLSSNLRALAPCGVDPYRSLQLASESRASPTLTNCVANQVRFIVNVRVGRLYVRVIPRIQFRNG
jgi:hypothetical protein